MKTIERTCPCGASLSYTDKDWRVDAALEEWDIAHEHAAPAPEEGPDPAPEAAR